MQRDAIYAKLTSLLQEVFDDDSLVARPDLTADQVDGWDSFAQLRLVFSVEKAFGISFAASQIANLKNLGEFAAIIEAKTAAS